MDERVCNFDRIGKLPKNKTLSNYTITFFHIFANTLYYPSFTIFVNNMMIYFHSVFRFTSENEHFFMFLDYCISSLNCLFIAIVIFLFKKYLFVGVPYILLLTICGLLNLIKIIYSNIF